MKRIFILLLSVFVLTGCSAGRDFRFVLRWGAGQGSVYNSESGLLIKTRQAADPDRFRTVLRLTGKERNELSALASAIDLARIPEIPEIYDPYSPPGTESGPREKPTVIVELTLWTEQGEKHIRCRNGSLLLPDAGEAGGSSPPPFDENGAAFEAFVRRALEIILGSEEWLSLPPYEVLVQ